MGGRDKGAEWYKLVPVHTRIVDVPEIGLLAQPSTDDVCTYKYSPSWTSCLNQWAPLILEGV